MSDKPGQIYQLLPKVAKDIGAIAKNRQGQGYKFRGIDDVLNAIHGPMCEHGVFVTTEVKDVSREERETKSGGSITYTRLLMGVTFWASDGSSVSTITAGEAMDVSDKSTNKAMSAAMKYAMFQTFTIPLEESEVEDDQHEPAPKKKPAAKPPAQPQRSKEYEDLRSAILGLGIDEKDPELVEKAGKIIAWGSPNGTHATLTMCQADRNCARAVLDEIHAKRTAGNLTSEDILREALGVPDPMPV